MLAYTIAAITPILPAAFEAVQSGKNVQVKFKDLGAHDDNEKNEMLRNAKLALEAKGYNADIQYSHIIKGSSPVAYRPFPCIWCNVEKRVRARDAVASSTKETAALRSELGELKAMLAQLVRGGVAPSTEVVAPIAEDGVVGGPDGVVEGEEDAPF